MAYVVNKTDGNIAAVVEDGTINTQSTLKLVGVGYPSYAETVAEDLVALMENFASANPPASPTVGQLWFNKSANQLMVFNSYSFVPVNNVKISSSAPSIPTDGDFWYDSVKKQLFFRRGDNWQIVAPLYSNDQGRTEFVSETITDTLSIGHTALVLYVSGIRQLIISSDSPYQTSPYIEGFNFINPGINIPGYAQTAENIYWGSNGNAFISAGITVGGTTGQLQYNSDGFLAGTDGIATDGYNLNSSGQVTAQVLQADTIKSTDGGIVFPDQTRQMSAATDVTTAVRGSGTANEVSYFNDTRSVTSSSSITTDGTNLTVTGTVSSGTILSTNGGIVFPDNTVQTTAAFTNASSVSGTGTASQLSYFNTSSTVTSTTGITTNGTALTVNGLLTVGANGIKFSDNSVMTTAPASANLSDVIRGAGVSGQLAYFNSANTVYHSTGITTNGTDLTLVKLTANNIKITGQGITFSDNTVQATSAITPGTFGSTGIQKLPGGLVIQWGSGGTVTGKGDPVTFNTPFTTACISVVANEWNAAGWDQSGVTHPTVYGIGGATKNGFNIWSSRVTGATSPSQGGLSFSWIALGY